MSFKDLTADRQQKDMSAVLNALFIILCGSEPLKLFSIP